MEGQCRIGARKFVSAYNDYQMPSTSDREAPWKSIVRT